MLKRDRIKIAMAHNPAELDLTRPWIESEEQSSGFTYLTGQQKIIMRCQHGTEQFDHTHFKYVSPAQNKASGHWPDMLEIQKYLLQPSWKRNALAVQEDPKRHEETRGTTFNITFSTEPGNKPSGIHVANIAKLGDEAHRDCVRRITKVMTAILKEHLADETSMEFRKIRWAVKATITAGDENNRWLSHIQINISNIDMGLAASLKKAGTPHIDKNDWPTMWTVLLFLSHYPENWNPGVLAIYSTRVCCPCDKYGACIMTATHPHSGRGKGVFPAGYVRPPKRAGEEELIYPALPADLPYQRINATGYPRNNNIQDHLPQISKELYDPSALGAFGTPQNWIEFQLRVHIKTYIEVIRDDPQYWYERFTYADENGVTYQPRLWVAELSFQYAEYAFSDVPQHKKLHKAVLSSGVGSTLPPDENAPPKEKRPKRQARALGESIVKVRCEGTRTNGERCRVSFQARADGITLCARHLKEVSSGADASNTEQEPVEESNDAESRPNDLKRSFDEREVLDEVAEMESEQEMNEQEDPEYALWDEGDENGDLEEILGLTDAEHSVGA